MKLFLYARSHDSLRRLTARASVVVAAILILAKLGAYFKTSSVALLSSLIDSGVDLLASIITAYGVIKASRPPDKDHRFGHGKAEALAATAQAAFIAGSSVLLSIEAIGRFVNPQPIKNLDVGFAAMGLAVVLTIALLILQTYTIMRTKSLAIASDRLHYIGDVLVNGAVVAALYLQGLSDEYGFIDPLFALIIAAFMFFGAWKIVRRALDVLMDAELAAQDRKTIEALALAVPGVHGVHDLRTRSDSEHPFVEMHVEMDPDITLIEAQKISAGVTTVIQAAFKGADVSIHQDPVGLKEKRLDEEIEKTEHV